MLHAAYAYIRTTNRIPFELDLMKQMVDRYACTIHMHIEQYFIDENQHDQSLIRPGFSQLLQAARNVPASSSQLLVAVPCICHLSTDPTVLAHLAQRLRDVNAKLVAAY